MYKLLAVLMLLLAGCASVEEKEKEFVIVGQPPVYLAGESAVGTLLDQHGEKLEIRQRIEADGTHLFLIREFVGAQEHVRFRSVVDITTGKGAAAADSIQSQLVENTCTSSRLYPITLGKVFECESLSISTGNVQVRSRMRFEFDTVEYDTDNNVRSFCALEHEDHGKMAATTRVCYSPDGKWIQHAELLQAVVYTQT